MAYFSQENKKTLAPGVKKVLAKYGVKGTLGVRHHSTFVVNIKSGPFDFIAIANRCSHQLPRIGWSEGRRPFKFKDYIDVNVYHISRYFDGTACEFLEELKAAMSIGNWDKSDIQSDYFNIGWYVDINIGQWDRPYEKV